MRAYADHTTEMPSIPVKRIATRPENEASIRRAARELGVIWARTHILEKYGVKLISEMTDAQAKEAADASPDAQCPAWNTARAPSIPANLSATRQRRGSTAIDPEIAALANAIRPLAEALGVCWWRDNGPMHYGAEALAGLTPDQLRGMLAAATAETAQSARSAPPIGDRKPLRRGKG